MVKMHLGNLGRLHLMLLSRTNIVPFDELLTGIILIAKSLLILAECLFLRSYYLNKMYFFRLLFLYEGKVVWQGMTDEFTSSTNPIVRQVSLLNSGEIYVIVLQNYLVMRVFTFFWLSAIKL